MDKQKIIIKFFRQMVLIRSIENLFLEYYTKGLIKGTVHTCLGQEACAVGVLNALDKKKDLVFSNHRAHGHYVAYGGPIKGLISEVMGKEVGICGGIGGTQHLHWKNFYTSGIQGGMVPSALGAAFAEKMNNSGTVTTVFIGDGTMGEGIVYECMNISSLWKLPVLYILENNCYAQTTPRHLAHVSDFLDRPRAFKITSMQQNGNDVEKVFETAKEAANRIRETNEPVFLMLNTYRMGPHSKGDDTRSPEELDKHKKNDPLLLTGNIISEDERDEIYREIQVSTAQIFTEISSQ
jgi:acetoin:2,6-dichlorophenolindophenol oxidoreductase subunit alpha